MKYIHQMDSKQRQFVDYTIFNQKEKRYEHLNGGLNVVLRTQKSVRDEEIRSIEKMYDNAVEECRNVRIKPSTQAPRDGGWVVKTARSVFNWIKNIF